MNIVLTGSLGNINKPLAALLVAKGHAVTVISRKADKREEIEALGAKAAIGSIEDASFLATTFNNKDIAYLMEPPVNYFDTNLNILAFYTAIARKYAQAVRQSGIKKIVHLSSIGGHTDKGNGMLRLHHEVENILGKLPNEVSIKTMRPVGFFNNMFSFIAGIKNANAIIQNYGGDKKEPWVSPLDIAETIAEEIENPFFGRTFRYIASDEISPNEIANVLGLVIGKPDLNWLEISNKQFEENLLSIGFSPQAATGLTEMNASRQSTLYEDYNKFKPILGKVKLADFSKEFAKAYAKS